MKPKFVYNKKLGALDICYKIEEGDNYFLVAVYQQHRGPLCKDVIGVRFGSGGGDTISEALSAALADASRNLRAGVV